MRVLAVGCLLLGIGATVQAEERPLDRTELDRRVVKVVYETAVLGTDVFNKGKPEECYRLYQGTLAAVLPLLDHRPKLGSSVKDKIEKAKAMKPAEGAFVLREALDEIQHEIAPSAKTEPKVEPKVEPKKSTLWERLGGEKGVTKIVDDLIALAIEDKKVDLLRGGKYKLDAKGMAHFKLMIVQLVSESTGGTMKYEGKDMKTAHAGMKIKAEEFDALAALLVETLKKQKIAQADIDELMKIVSATKTAIVEGKDN